MCFFVQILNLKENQLVGLPSTIGFCTSLVELHLGEGLKGGTIGEKGKLMGGCASLVELRLSERGCAWVALREGRGRGCRIIEERLGGGGRARALCYAQVRSSGICLTTLAVQLNLCSIPECRIQCAGLPPG